MRPEPRPPARRPRRPAARVSSGQGHRHPNRPPGIGGGDGLPPPWRHPGRLAAGRLGRSLRHLVETVAGWSRPSGWASRSLHERIDTTTSTGRLVFHIFAALAEFERDLIVDRTKAGLAALPARGVKPGRKPSLSAEQVKVVRHLHEGGEHTVAEIAGIVGVSRATVYRCLSSPTSPSQQARLQRLAIAASGSVSTRRRGVRARWCSCPA